MLKVLGTLATVVLVAYGATLWDRYGQRVGVDKMRRRAVIAIVVCVIIIAITFVIDIRTS